jgi:hypothetical protein
MSRLLEDALEYERLGLSVVPLHTPTASGCSCRKGPACGSPGKHARIAWKELQQRRATSDEIRAWWTRWPLSNVGIVTGTVSRLAVFDVDVRNGGFATLIELDHYGGPMPDDNPVVVTGSGGLHHYFALDAAMPTAAAFEGIDVKANGGLVVAPPSLHASGGHYRFARPITSPRPPLPHWIRWAVNQVTAPATAPAPPRPNAHADDVLGALVNAGLYIRPHRRRGLHRVRCPWASGHSNADVEAVVLEPGASPAAGWAFRCLHSHCAGRGVGDLLDALGIARRRTSR